jgi:hypothetical protein
MLTPMPKQRARERTEATPESAKERAAKSAEKSTDADEGDDSSSAYATGTGFGTYAPPRDRGALRTSARASVELEQCREVINRFRTKHRDELAESQHGIPLAPMHQLERDAGLDPISNGFATHEYSRSQMLIMRSLVEQYHWIYLDPGTGSLRPQTALENYVRDRMYQKMIAAMTTHCATFMPSHSDQSASDVGRLFDMVMSLEGETDFEATMAITARLTNGTMFKTKDESLQEWLTRFNDLCIKLAEVEQALSQKQRAQYMINFVNQDGRYRRTIFEWQQKARYGQPATV